MGLIKATRNEMQDYLLDVQNLTLATWLTIHDEVDLIVDFNLAKPVMRQATIIGHCKKEIDILSPVPYINFIFDVEFDDTGSFTATSNLGNSNDIPTSPRENKALKEYKELIERIKNTTTEKVETKKVEKTKPEKVGDTSNTFVIQDSLIMNLLIDMIDLMPDGESEIRIKLSSGKILTYKRKVDLSNFKVAFLRNQKL